jgi:hypothetical protein
LENEIRWWKNGSPLYFEDSKPFIVDGSVLVPLRAVAENLDARVKREPPKFITIPRR